MPTTAKTAAQTWIRAELVGVPESAFGPQLMIPADGVEFHGPDLVFHREGEVVYVTRPDQLRSLTWLGPTADPERERRRAQWPNHGKRWTEEQRETLRAAILAGTAWTEIAKSHGRSRTGVQQEAVKQGWVDAETLRPAAALLDGGSGRSAEGEPDASPEFEDRDDLSELEALDAAESVGSHRVRVRPRRREGPEGRDGGNAPAGNGGATAARAHQLPDAPATVAPSPTHYDHGSVDEIRAQRDDAAAIEQPSEGCGAEPHRKAAAEPTREPSPPGIAPPGSPPSPSLPVRLLGSYVTTAGPDPSPWPPFPDSAPPAATIAPPPADWLSPSSLPPGLGTGAPGTGRDPGRGVPPRAPDPVAPAIPRPRDPDRTPPDPVREPARLTPARPPGT